ncbi:hypothetical protein DV736_g5099, partial [Chaetothyriales sp. CBS 134916]
MVFTDSEQDEDSLDPPSPPKYPFNADPLPAKRRRAHSLQSVSSTSNTDASNQQEESHLLRDPDRIIAPLKKKVSWSSDEAADSLYNKLKNKKKQARSQAIKSAKRAKATEEGRNPRPTVSGATGVGKRATKRQRTAGSRNFGDATDDKGDLMEWTMPDYIQKRRARFNERRDKLKEGGLELPPTFDDIDFSDDEHLKSLKERPDFPHLKPCAPYKDIELPFSLGLIPAPIAQHLREYQVKGAAFLHELFVYQKGGILGDDMGLGKTIQVIAFLTAAYGKTGDERDRKRINKARQAGQKYPRTLIICPGTLMANWQDELKRWGWWHVALFHGSQDQKCEVITMAQQGHIEIVITTYETYRLDCERKGAINLVKWDCVIADECHKIKERKASITRCINEVNALCRVGLTGTAIQNKYEELWTLLNWTNPGDLGPISTWKASICVPLKLGQSHNASNYELARARKTAKLLVRNLLPRFFLRRTKVLIRDQLPKKSDRVVFCPLTEIQANAYQQFLASDIVTSIKHSSELCFCGSNKKQGWCCEATTEDGRRWQHWVFPALTTLQKLSNHLALLIPSGNDSKEKQAKDLEMIRIIMPDNWKELYRHRDSMLHTGNPEFCGKWKVLRKLLKFWYDQGNNKVLVFSHSVRLLKMLQSLFVSTAYNVSYLDGAMEYEDRFAAVQEFNTDPTQFVFLISTRAGGTGLNITSANKVVVMDPNWNPAYDLQAQDRAYRIGQTRDVEVFRLVSQGTLEEIVYARQIYKQQQARIGYDASSERRYFQGVQDRKDRKGEIFGLENMFTYQNENVVLRDIVNKTNIAESKAGLQVTELDVDSDQQSQLPSTSVADSDDGRSDVNPSFLNDTTDPDASAEDAMMSQLATEITGSNSAKKRKKQKSNENTTPTSTLFSNNSAKTAKHDPIQAILSSVGVAYTHENSQVIGTSKVEAHLSKQAEAAAEGTSTGNNNNSSESWDVRRQLARVFVPDSQSSQTGISPRAAMHLYGNDDDYDDDDYIATMVKYRFNPPEAVMRRQFCSMARWAGYANGVVKFALVVEHWTQAQRRDFLDR